MSHCNLIYINQLVSLDAPDRWWGESMLYLYMFSVVGCCVFLMIWSFLGLTNFHSVLMLSMVGSKTELASTYSVVISTHLAKSKLFLSSTNNYYGLSGKYKLFSNTNPSTTKQNTSWNHRHQQLITNPNAKSTMKQFQKNSQICQKFHLFCKFERTT